MSELFKPYRLAFMSPEGGETPGGDAAAADMVDAGAERPDESTPLTDEQVFARVESAMKLSFQKPEIKIGDGIFKPKSFFPGLMLTYEKGFEAAQTQNPFPELKSPEEFQKAWEAMAQRFLGNLEGGVATDAAVDGVATVGGTAGAVDSAATDKVLADAPAITAQVAAAPEQVATTPEKAEKTLADTLKEKKADILKVIDAHPKYSPKNHDWIAINAEMMKAVNGPEGKGDEKSVMDFAKTIQEMLKVEVDGKIGPITMGALKNYLNGIPDSVENAPDKFVKIEFTDAEYGEITRLLNEGKSGDPFTLEDVKKMSISVDKNISLKATYDGEDTKKVVETFNAKLTEKESPPIGMYIQSTASYKKAYAEANSPAVASDIAPAQVQTGASAEVQTGAPAEPASGQKKPDAVEGATASPAPAPSPAPEQAPNPDPTKNPAQATNPAPAPTDGSAEAPAEINKAERKAEILKQRGENWKFTGDSTIGRIDRSKADDLLASKMAEQGYTQNTKVKIEAYNTRPNGVQQLYEVFITIGSYKYIGRTPVAPKDDPNLAFQGAVKLIKTSQEDQAEATRKAEAKAAAEKASQPAGPDIPVNPDSTTDAGGQDVAPVNSDKPAQVADKTAPAPETISGAEWTFKGNRGDQLEKANAKEELGKLLYQKGYRTIKNIVITADEVDENRTGTPGKEYIVTIKLDGQEFEGIAFDLATAFKTAALAKIPNINADVPSQQAPAIGTAQKPADAPRPVDAPPPVQQAVQGAPVQAKAAGPVEANKFNQETFDAVLKKINDLPFFDTTDLKADPQSKERLSRAIIDKGYDENTEIIMSSRTYEDNATTYHVVEMTLDGVEYKATGLNAEGALGQLIKEIGKGEKVTPLSESDRQTINVIKNKLAFPENAKDLDTPVARAQLARKIFDQKYGADATISIGMVDFDMGTGPNTATKVTIQINGVSYDGTSAKKHDANGVKAFKNAISNINRQGA